MVESHIPTNCTNAQEANRHFNGVYLQSNWCGTNWENKLTAVWCVNRGDWICEAVWPDRLNVGWRRCVMCDDHRRRFIERRWCAEEGQQAYSVNRCRQHSVGLLSLAVPIRRAETRGSLREIHRVLMACQNCLYLLHPTQGLSTGYSSTVFCCLPSRRRWNTCYL